MRLGIKLKNMTETKKVIMSIISKPKASVQALGCRLNQYEGLSLEGKLREAGYDIVPFGESADLGVINTCTVTNEADAKSRNAIRRFSKRIQIL